MSLSIATLRRTLKLELAELPKSVLPFGIAALDAALPKGGLDLTGLHDIVAPLRETRYLAAGTLFAAGILARLSGPVVWCRRQDDLFAPVLGTVGLDPARVLWVDAGDETKLLACIEDSLRHGGASAVVGEVRKLTMTASRRLQLAAKEGNTLCLLLLRHRRLEEGSKPLASAAQTRWCITPLPAPATSLPVMPRGRWQVELRRCRGGEAATFIMEACDATGHLASPAELVDRSLAAQPGPRRTAG